MIYRALSFVTNTLQPQQPIIKLTLERALMTLEQRSLACSQVLISKSLSSLQILSANISVIIDWLSGSCNLEVKQILITCA